MVVWVVGDATVNGSETGTSFRQALYFIEIGFNLHDTMIYEKDDYHIPTSNRYFQTFEFMFVFSKDAPSTFNPLVEKTKGYKPSRATTVRQPDGTKKGMKYEMGKEMRKKGNVWFYHVGYMKSTSDKMAYEHPAMFPEALARDHILSWSNPGDLVLDPLCGSGTVLKMAKESGRHWIGMDISERYCILARKRIAAARVPLFP